MNHLATEINITIKICNAVITRSLRTDQPWYARENGYLYFRVTLKL